MDINKSQSATVGAVLLAGLLLHPTGNVSKPIPRPTSPPAELGATAPSAISKGPWLASCKYWAPDRVTAGPPSGNLPAKMSESSNGAPPSGTAFTVEFKAGTRADVYQHPASEEYERECGTDRLGHWGIPNGGAQLLVTALIATVPDPVHTHLALEFDRRIDALLQAASDNGYLTSYYWLPWKYRSGFQRVGANPLDAEAGPESERESQPGLIILKSDSPGNGHRDVIYVFLVGETPTEGVDGFQFQNALGYEDELAMVLAESGHQFFRGQKDSHGDKHTSIIGPTYTGSAASLKAGIAAAAENAKGSGSFFDVAGASQTCKAVESLKTSVSDWPAAITYVSFDHDAEYAKNQLLNRLTSSGYDLSRVALLSEDNTAYGSVEAGGDPLCSEKPLYAETPLVIRFPREISLLRNAESNRNQADSEAQSAGSSISPYLHLSLKDSSAQDSIPQFSRENTPLSQEAQLMAIARQLERYRIQFIAIVASTNPLDQIFLAQFLHRARPDARLVFLNADLMMEREIDNVPFIGSLTLTPYNLSELGKLPANVDPSGSMRAYPESSATAYYNAVTYTIWSIAHSRGLTQNGPKLMNYRNPLASERDPLTHPPLWVTAVGTDGYYPLAILSPCASNLLENLPTIDQGGQHRKVACPADQRAQGISQDLSNLRKLPVYPSVIWVVICTLIGLVCFFHVLLVCLADYRSPFTRDLAIRNNDQPARRSSYLWVGTAVLFCMAFIVAYPTLSLLGTVRLDFIDVIFGGTTLGLGLLAIFTAAWKTRGFMGWIKFEDKRPPGLNLAKFAYLRLGANVHFLINCLAWAMAVVVPVIWICCCGRNQIGDSAPGTARWYSLTGMCFTFRCLHPNSGLCPLVPVLLLLLGWYLWAFLQARRLRFSAYGTPGLPRRLQDPAANLLYVAEEDVNSCDDTTNSCLYEIISCLFISERVLSRIKPERRWIAAVISVIMYCILLIYVSVFCPIRSLGSFLWRHSMVADPFVMIVGLLFFPLLAVGLAGWLRMILVWGSLKVGVLARLENQPIRFAFDRLQGMGWMAMLRQAGLDQQATDIARSVESAGQMLHQQELLEALTESQRRELDSAKTQLERAAAKVLGIANRQDSLADQKTYQEQASQLELGLADFGQKLLGFVLIPFWQNRRIGLVESKEAEERPIRARHAQRKSGDRQIPLELHAGLSSAEPGYIQAAEEFLAIRYVSLIRAVLSNMRYVMTFVSASFVLAIVAWNSYPFQPRHDINWLFTGLLAILGSGIVWVFAQMHRDPILSRVTETKANELGIDFYFRILAFGAVPILTWLASQFPEIGNTIFKFIQPGIDVVK